MTRISRIGIALMGAALALAGGTAAIAQMDGEVEAAIASGAVGEQADGYLGVPQAPGYTQVAQAKNVPIEAFAASIGCKTLAGLRAGRSYSVAKGVWATKGAAPIALPSQCGA